MEKKTLIIYITIAILLLAGIGTGVACLYKGVSTTSQEVSADDVRSAFPMSATIPSDAVAVAFFRSAKDGVSMLCDETKAFGALVGDGPQSPYGRFLAEAAAAVGNAPVAVSLHKCTSLEPSMIFDAGRNPSDSSAMVLELLDFASAAGLKARYVGEGGKGYVITSTSDAIVSSAARHITEGVSILANKDFLACAVKTAGPDAIFFSNNHADLLLSSFLTRKVAAHSKVVRNAASWTSFSISEAAERKVVLKGEASSFAGSFVDVAADLPMSESRFSTIAPASTFNAISLCISGVEDYMDTYDRFLEATGSLADMKVTRRRLGESRKVGVIEWAKAIDVREVAQVQWYAGSEPVQVTLVRAGKPDARYLFRGLLGVETESDYQFIPQEYYFAGYVSALVGKTFCSAGDPYYVYKNGWLVSGTQQAVADFVAKSTSTATLSEALSATPDLLPQKYCSLLGYYCPSAAHLEDHLGSALRHAAAGMQVGAGRVDAVLACTSAGLTMTVVRPLEQESSAPQAEVAVTGAGLEVPAGPFEVTNCATGQKNALKQYDNYYIGLLDETGKAQWSIPFTEPMCGRVETIDFYNNGKLQFLFAAGSKLYLLDRLGRFVSGFPASLPKEVLLGPAAYDFSGVGGYTAVVLHKDNSVGMYNLHGVPVESWKGISVDAQITAVPEPVSFGGKRYWVVRTVRDARIFEANGGEPVYAKTGKDAIRSDSPVEAVEKGFKVILNEGKDRIIKL